MTLNCDPVVVDEEGGGKVTAAQFELIDETEAEAILREAQALPLALLD